MDNCCCEKESSLFPKEGENPLPYAFQFGFYGLIFLVIGIWFPVALWIAAFCLYLARKYWKAAPSL